MYILIIFLVYIRNVSSLNCEDVLELSESKSLSLSELQTLEPIDVSLCLTRLGRKNLTLCEAQFIWNSLRKLYIEIEYIPEDILISLHYVTVAIKPEDYTNMTLRSINVVTNFGFYYGLSDAQLTAIADRVRKDFGDKKPEDYTNFDLIALRQILCAFNKSEIVRIHPKAYKGAAVLIGKLENCKAEVMQGFAHLAVQRDAFDEPSTWSLATVRLIGNVIQFIPTYSTYIQNKT